MKQNIYHQRIQEWEKQYGGLSPNAQKKLKKLLEEFEKTQSVSKTNKALSLAIGTKLIREYQGKTIVVIDHNEEAFPYFANHIELINKNGLLTDK